MAKRITDVLWGAPLPPHIKEEGRRPPALGARHGGSPTRTPLLVGFGPSLFPFFIGGEKEGVGEGEGKRERGAPPPPLVLFGLP